jgi:CelD/BcsL family acetyltransferase involved in cellulose biosynthesis
VPGLEWSRATDVHSVYGYPGPLAWGVSAGDPFVEHAVRLIVETWRSQGAVSVFTRFHPLLDNASLLRDLRLRPDQDAAQEGVIAAGPTVSVDLTLAPTEIRAGYGRDLARQIRVARRAGLGTEPDAALALLHTFSDLYSQTMARLGASEFYFFREADFERLAKTLPGAVRLLVTSIGSDVAAAGLFFEYGGVAEWHLVGTSDKFGYLSPSKVLVDDAILWARDRGNRVLHMGGGHGGREDALFWFKSRYSPRRHVFETGRWVIEPREYAALVDARLAVISGPGRLDPDFFPVYRAPLVADQAAPA